MPLALICSQPSRRADTPALMLLKHNRRDCGGIENGRKRHHECVQITFTQPTSSKSQRDVVVLRCRCAEEL